MCESINEKHLAREKKRISIDFNQNSFLPVDSKCVLMKRFITNLECFPRKLHQIIVSKEFSIERHFFTMVTKLKLMTTIQ